MTTSDLFSVWPYEGSWVLSQGTTTDYEQPEDGGDESSEDFSLVESLCSGEDADVATVGFLRYASIFQQAVWLRH